MKHNAVPHPLQQPAQSLAAYQEPPRTAVLFSKKKKEQQCLDAHCEQHINNVGSTGAGLRDRSRSVEILCLTCSKDCDAARKLGSKLRSHPTPPPRIHICSFYSHVCLPVITPCASMATAMAAAIIGVSFSWNSGHLRLRQPWCRVRSDASPL